MSKRNRERLKHRLVQQRLKQLEPYTGTCDSELREQLGEVLLAWSDPVAKLRYLRNYEEFSSTIHRGTLSLWWRDFVKRNRALDYALRPPETLAFAEELARDLFRRVMESGTYPARGPTDVTFIIDPNDPLGMCVLFGLTQYCPEFQPRFDAINDERSRGFFVGDDPVLLLDAELGRAIYEDLIFSVADCMTPWNRVSPPPGKHRVIAIAGGHVIHYSVPCVGSSGSVTS